MIKNQDAFDKAIMDIAAERDSQPAFSDSLNTEGLWTAYIANYASRWSLPRSFDTEKYDFRSCMVKTAALAVAAIEWYDSGVHNDVEAFLAKKVEISAKIDRLRHSEELAFGIIANAWDAADKVTDWKEAAERWRDNFFKEKGSDN